MTTDDRAIREPDNKRVREFTSGTYHLVDSTYNPNSAVSVYVYIQRHEDVCEADYVWYIVNDRGLYYMVYDNMNDLIAYLENGCMQRYCDLTPQEMLLVDKEIDKC